MAHVPYCIIPKRLPSNQAVVSIEAWGNEHFSTTLHYHCHNSSQRKRCPASCLSISPRRWRQPRIAVRPNWQPSEPATAAAFSFPDRDSPATASTLTFTSSSSLPSPSHQLYLCSVLIEAMPSKESPISWRKRLLGSRRPVISTPSTGMLHVGGRPCCRPSRTMSSLLSGEVYKTVRNYLPAI